MAKSSKPTNAFGFDPNSFKAIPNKKAEEKNQPEPIPAPVVQAETPAPAAAAEATQGTGKKKRDPNRERKTCHIHFLMKESLLLKVDAHADKQGLSRAAVIEKALKAYLMEYGD